MEGEDVGRWKEKELKVRRWKEREWKVGKMQLADFQFLVYLADLYLQTITIAQCSDNISKKQFLGFIKGIARNSNLFLNFRYV